MTDAALLSSRDDRHWRGRHVLVTGAGGFLGRWLTESLRQAGAEIVALSPRIGNRREDGITFVSADIRERASLTPIFERHAIDTVFHLAAQTLPTLARQDPEATFDINARGSWNLLEAARRARTVPTIIFSSTDSVYGENDGQPFTEDAPLAPTFPYEASKACAEIVARCYGQTYGMQVAFARFCNLYGPGDIAAGRLISGTISAVIAGQRQTLRGDGLGVRNYLYVEDAVEALLTLAKALLKPGSAGEAFNFCDETPYSVVDIVGHILRLAERPDLEPRFGVGTPGEISIKRATAEKARRSLGWRPQVTLEDGLRRTIAWHRTHLRDTALAEAAT